MFMKLLCYVFLLSIFNINLVYSYDCYGECIMYKGSERANCMSACQARYKNMEKINQKMAGDFSKSSETSSSKSCFIATAAYGSGDNESVEILRQYRDKILLKSEYGTLFVAHAETDWLKQSEIN